MKASPYRRDCGSRQVLDRIGDRWSVLVVIELGRERRRFTELSRRIEGVSQKMLTQTLRGLERDGLVVRTVHPEVPVRVEYELTALGHDLLRLVAALEAWATSHLGDVEAAQARYDA